MERGGCACPDREIDNSPHDDRIWPVLVFKKSEYGDLHHFASLIIGRKLGFQQRLKLCLDVGAAIAHMHSQHKSPIAI